MRRRARGQALVEFAIAGPLFIAFVFVIIQIGLVFIAYYSTAEMALRAARWLAINHDTPDDQFGAYLQGQMLPGMSGGTPTVSNPGAQGTPAQLSIGALTVRYTACVYNGTICTNEERGAGSELFVETAYDLSNWVFLPGSFNFGLFNFTVPTSLPTYRVYKMVE